MQKITPFIKSHYSISKSILTLDKPTGYDSYPSSIFDMLIHHKIDTLTLVEDTLSGILEANENCVKNKIKLQFGLRLWVTEDMTSKNNEALPKRARYIVFLKNTDGYKDLIKIWTTAATEGFYYCPCIDFKTLAKLWSKNLKFAVPFYDSFLHLNNFENHSHVPDFSVLKPAFFIENNSLPFDPLLKNIVDDFCRKESYETYPAQSIYYKKPEDFDAYMTLRCISNKSDIEKPNFDHMSSNEFNFEKWAKMI